MAELLERPLAAGSHGNPKIVALATRRLPKMYFREFPETADLAPPSGRDPFPVGFDDVISRGDNFFPHFFFYFNFFLIFVSLFRSIFHLTNCFALVLTTSLIFRNSLGKYFTISEYYSVRFYCFTLVLTTVSLFRNIRVYIFIVSR